MMRYSEIPRDFSTDSLRFAELGEDQVYRTLLDDSPPSESSSHSGATLPLLAESTASAKKDAKHIKHASAAAAAAAAALAANDDADTKKKQRQRKNSDCAVPQAALTQSASGGGYYNYSLGMSTPNKTQSLPPNASIKGLDTYVLSALRVSPDELAGQITLLDFPDFRAIQPDELTSCAWTNKKNKHIVAPNIVAFTKRFNHTSFWTVQEILSAPTPKQRAEIMVHFVKVAKKLFELNNLHSLFAIVSALQTASIFRLQRTWSCLSRKDKNTFDRLADIFSDKSNWTNLREHLESLRLPCIPYLGLFLTDLVYIDLAHPHPSGGLEPVQRRNQMNNILRIISSYQGSDYTHIVPVAETQRYLQSIRYIEELQNIFEDDQYKISLKLEPPSGGSSVPSSSSCSSKESVTPNACQMDPSALASLNLSPAKTPASGSMRLTASASKFIPGHRKCRSLGSKIRSTSLPRNFHQKCYCAMVVAVTVAGVASMAAHPSSGTNGNKCRCRIFNKTNSQVAPGPDGSENVSLQQSRHLLDDSVLEDRLLCTALTASDATSTGSSEGTVDSVLNAGVGASGTNGGGGGGGGGCLSVVGYQTQLQYQHQQSQLAGQQAQQGFQGCVRRKTVLKDGRKPAVASWQRYWLQICANSLVYFPPKSFKGSDRSDFKREPCKVCSLDGWSAQLLENPQQMNTFQLISTQLGTVYKFRTSTPEMCARWLDSLRRDGRSKSATSLDRQVPVNLMTFE